MAIDVPKIKNVLSIVLDGLDEILGKYCGAMVPDFVDEHVLLQELVEGRWTEVEGPDGLDFALQNMDAKMQRQIQNMEDRVVVVGDVRFGFALKRGEEGQDRGVDEALEILGLGFALEFVLEEENVVCSFIGGAGRSRSRGQGGTRSSWYLSCCSRGYVVVLVVLSGGQTGAPAGRASCFCEFFSVLQAACCHVAGGGTTAWIPFPQMRRWSTNGGWLWVYPVFVPVSAVPARRKISRNALSTVRVADNFFFTRGPPGLW